MFDLYTESARQVVFWARYAAEGSKRIEIDHLLRGIVSVEACFRESSLGSVVPAVERAIGSAAGKDMGLSFPAKRVLAHAAEEGVHQHGEINCLHLALGILREGKSEAARLLLEHGFTREAILSRLPPARSVPPVPWALANQHVVLFWIGLVIWLAIVGFSAWHMWPLPAEERGDRVLRLGVLMAFPLLGLMLTWGIAIILSLLGFGFRSGRFTARSRVMVPLACVAVYLFHRFVLISMI